MIAEENIIRSKLDEIVDNNININIKVLCQIMGENQK